MKKERTPEEKEALLKQRMANISPFVKDSEYARECARKGAIAKNKKKAERKKIKDDLNTLLKIALKRGDIVDGEDIMNLEEAQEMNVNVQTAINIAMIKRAMLGDVQAAQYIRDTLGEKPSDKVELDTNLTIESWAKNHKVKL